MTSKQRPPVYNGFYFWGDCFSKKADFDFFFRHFFQQELLALSTALSATLTAQLAFDPKHLKYCSTYNLAEGVDESNKKKEIYHLVGKA